MCFFFLLANDIHIVNLTSFIPLIFDHFASKLTIVGLYVQPRKCDVWSPFGLPLGFPPPPHSFCCPPNNIKVSRVPFGFLLFSSSLLQNVLGEDIHYVSLFPRLGNVQVIFGISMFCAETFLFVSCIPTPPKLSTLACMFQFDLHVGF